MAELKKILYVEDDADIRTVAEIALDNIGGFTLQICSSGEEAVQCGENFAPDLILLDVIMPGMDGPSTLAALRQLKPLANTPVMFMTGMVQAEEIAHLKSLGAMDVIPKPFDPMTLASELNKLWDQYQN